MPELKRFFGTKLVRIREHSGFQIDSQRGSFIQYKLVVTYSYYQAAQEWLLEDEPERIKGQLWAEEVL
jgi:hypothetical protein